MDSFEEIFNLVKDYCKTQMTEVAYNLWIKDIEPMKLTVENVRLGVNSEFKQNIVSEKYKDLLSKGFERILGFPVEVNIECISPEDVKPKPKYNIIGFGVTDEVGLGHNPTGDYDYTFDTFIVGSSNKFAHAAAMAVATHDIRK